VTQQHFSGIKHRDAKNLSATTSLRLYKLMDTRLSRDLLQFSVQILS